MPKGRRLHLPRTIKCGRPEAFARTEFGCLVTRWVTVLPGVAYFGGGSGGSSPHRAMRFKNSGRYWVPCTLATGRSPPRSQLHSSGACADASLVAPPHVIGRQQLVSAHLPSSRHRTCLGITPIGHVLRKRSTWKKYLGKVPATGTCLRHTVPFLRQVFWEGTFSIG